MNLISKINDGFTTLTQLVKLNSSAIDKRVRVDATQILSSAEQAQARQNIGISDTQVGGTGLFDPILYGNKWYTAGKYYDTRYPLSATTYAINTTYPNRTLYLMPTRVLEDTVITALSMQCSTSQAGASCMIGIYDADLNTNFPKNLLFKSGSLDLSTTGAKTATCSLQMKKGQIIYLAFLNIFTGTASATINSLNTLSLNMLSGFSSASSAHLNGLSLTNMTDLPDICPYINPMYLVYVPRVTFSV